MRHRAFLSLLTVLLVCILLAAGCTTGTQNGSPLPPKVSSSKNSQTGSTAAPQTATTGQTGQGTVPDSPKLIKTAEMTIEVGKGEFESKFEAAKNVAVKFGGHVTNSVTSRQQGQMISGTVTIRVPTKQFDTAIAALKTIGQVDNLSVKAEDVGQEYVDLQSRLKNYQAQEAQLLAIMTKAQTVAETLQVEEQLTSVQGEIEVIKGRMQYLDNQVDLSTINITVQEPGAVVPSSNEWGLSDALSTAARAFIWVIDALIVLVGALLPLFLLWLVFHYARKYLKTRNQK
jgi:hypothetical protein